jgi:AraC family transcriptional regulator
LVEIALAVETALERRRTRGEAGRAVSHVLARGEGWSVADVVCTSGPGDRVFEEQHRRYAIAIVLTGTFQYRSRAGNALMSPGSLMLGSPGQCFECGHEHAEGDRCVSFWYSREYFERLAADAGPVNRHAFDILRIPPVRTLAPVVAAAAAKVMDATHAAWDEIGVELAAGAIALSSGIAVRDRLPINAEARVTRVLRSLDQFSQASFTLDEMAQRAGLSPYHFLRTFERLTGTTPHQYVLRTRLRQAALRLVSGGDKVVDIALDCGFGDLSNFNRAFRAEFRVSPRAYRRRTGSGS